jgi:hypothetical protein
MASVDKKQIKLFLKETGYTEYTNEHGVRKNYKNRNEWKFVSIEQLLKDFAKWQKRNY